jgi:AraC-type DNA-binding domain-containing proteins
MTDIRMDEIRNRLIDYLEVRKIFLEPNISLIKLSMEVGTNTTYLSNIINQYYKCNFHSVINNYRIQYAKKLLLEGKYDVAEVVIKSGYTSRSVFFSAFQRIEGTSPLNFLVQKRILSIRTYPTNIKDTFTAV